MQLTTDKQARKSQPIARGVLDYFGKAIAAVANVSFVGNEQHNPGQPMHWAREKSTDHADCIARHLIERGTIDDDNLRHSAKAAWRALALLQLEIERDENIDAAASEVAHEDRNAEMIDRAGTGEFDQRDDWKDLKPLNILGLDDVYTIFVTQAEQPFIPQDSAWQPKPEQVASPGYVVSRQGNSGDFEYDEAVAIATSEYPVRGAAWMFEALTMLGVPKPVQYQIVHGTYFAREGNDMVYLAGPMRGIDKNNFPAFDAARDRLSEHGYTVISPADIDRAAGDQVGGDQRTYAYRDIAALMMLAYSGSGSIAMLPGWEKSTGGVAEFFLSRWLGLRIIDAVNTQSLNLSLIKWDDLILTVQQYLSRQLLS